MEGGEDCCVKVAVHIRPIIGDEKVRGCKDWVSVVPGKPQIQTGTHSFTFDHVYGSTGSPPAAIFEECVSPLVDGLFQGYNATVLAYGQTGSGKTYTMGTGSSCQTGIIPQVMAALFEKIESLKHETDFQLHVSYIEILKEEVQDLLDSTTKMESGNVSMGKVPAPGKLPIQIRETSSGVIALTGCTEVNVSTLEEMAACLEQGSFSRATGSTNMNNQSSRSHAIFTITLEQKVKSDLSIDSDSSLDDSLDEGYLCAKLHLVDLAGSERAKRTGSDGLRFKEGVHINRGLLALGNVISALGDEKKRKEVVHVPYRDSKLTRLLQDSLGGNSRTTMIACISPADINAEETLNTLKYANRARNIKNKPVVNRNPVSIEMLKMRQQIESLQAELSARGGGSQSNQVQILMEKIAWLEATNEKLSRELQAYRSRCSTMEECDTFTPMYDDEYCSLKYDGLKRGLHSMNSTDHNMTDIIAASEPKVTAEEAAKEWEHKLLQNSMDKELNELNKRLEQKESEMKLVGGFNTEELKQLFRKKITELEEEKNMVQQDRDNFMIEIQYRSLGADGQTQKLQDVHTHKLKSLEAQILDLMKKQENQVQILKQKEKSEEAAKRLQQEIQFIKAQKVQLQNKIKQAAEQFRQWKASRETELLQLRKDGRKNEYEKLKLQALNQRQKLVLQRKTEEAAVATKRLKELLESKKSSMRDHAVPNGNAANGQSNEKSFQKWLDHELEVIVKVHEVHFEYEKQSQVQAALGEELAVLKQFNEFASKGINPPKGKNVFSRLSSMSPNARMSRISSLQSMLQISSNSMVAMASQLSEAEERERSLFGRGRWNQLRSMGEAKSLLQYMFNQLSNSRCQLWERDMEIKEMEEQIKEIVNLLRQSETRRVEVEKELKLREHNLAVALASSVLETPQSPLENVDSEMNSRPSLMYMPAQKQLKYTPGVVNRSRESLAVINPTQTIPLEQLSRKKILIAGRQAGKLRKYKRSHHQWLLQFKWKWQKPWRLSEMIVQSDKSLKRSKPRSQARLDNK
ncbi:unnamed protein product [Rhodiola kirilowii]